MKTESEWVALSCQHDSQPPFGEDIKKEVKKEIKKDVKKEMKKEVKEEAIGF